VPAVDQFTAVRQQALARAKECLIAAQCRQKVNADRHRRPVNIAEGDMVLLSSKNIKIKHPGTRKLLPRWLGPFRITKAINPVAFKLDLPENMKSLHPVFHASLLKPYRSDGVIQPPPPIILEDGDVLFEVDMLLDKRPKSRGRGRRPVFEYLVKWAGYSHEHNTWEPASHIGDPSLITDLDNRLQAKAEADRLAKINRQQRKAKRSRQ